MRDLRTSYPFFAMCCSFFTKINYILIILSFWIFTLSSWSKLILPIVIIFLFLYILISLLLYCTFPFCMLTEFLLFLFGFILPKLSFIFSFDCTHSCCVDFQSLCKVDCHFFAILLSASHLIQCILLSCILLSFYFISLFDICKSLVNFETTFLLMRLCHWIWLLMFQNFYLQYFCPCHAIK